MIVFHFILIGLHVRILWFSSVISSLSIIVVLSIRKSLYVIILLCLIFFLCWIMKHEYYRIWLNISIPISEHRFFVLRKRKHFRSYCTCFNDVIEHVIGRFI